MFKLKLTEMKNKLLIGILIGALVSTISASLYLAGVFDTYELRTFDMMMRKMAKGPGSREIILVEVDQESLDSLKKEGVTWPWPRQVYAPVIDYLSEAGAKAVFFDILYTEASSYGEEDDRVFAESVEKAGNVYMPYFLSVNEKEAAEGEELFLERHSRKIKVEGAQEEDRYRSVILPIPPLLKASKGVGNVQMKADPDGIYRRIPLLFQYKGKWFPHMCLDSVNGGKGDISLTGSSIMTAGKTVPYENDSFRLKFYGGVDYYRRYGASSIIRSYMDMKGGGTPALPPSLFKDKYIFIGLTAPGLYDLRPTPVSSIYPGTAIHMTFLDNMIRDDYLRRAGKWTLLPLIIALSLLSSTLVINSSSLIRNALYFVAVGLLIITASVASFHFNLLLDPVILLFSFTTGFTVSAAFSYSTEGKQKRQVKRVFSFYMNEALVEELLKNPDKLRLGGEKRELTVLFSDLKGFTSISEKSNPEDIVKILNIYLTEMTDIIMSKGGIIDKYLGDGIMAFWGAPIKREDDIRRACLACLEYQKRLAELRVIHKDIGFGELYARIGMNTGEMIVGNMGSERRFDYTVMGDSVNLASRLEGANKVYSTDIMVSESTYVYVKDDFEFRELDYLRVKGKEEPVRIYELMAEKGQLSGEKMRLLGIYNEGLALYRAGKREEAAAAFKRCLEIDQEDGPSLEYLRRCEELQETGSVYIMDSK